MKQAIMIGAGNIGRGFIGAILSRSGYHVTFADVNMTLIDAINAEGRYTVHIQDRNPAAFTITNIDGISSAGPELAEALKTAELVTTAVGLRILPIVAKPIAAGIAARKAAGNAAPLNIVACENAVRATSQLKRAVYDAAGRRDERRLPMQTSVLPTARSTALCRKWTLLRRWTSRSRSSPSGTWNAPAGRASCRKSTA